MASMRTMMLVLLAACILPAGPAKAQFLLWPQYRSWSSDHRHWPWGDPARLPHGKPQHRYPKPESAKKGEAQDRPQGPLQIIISIADQRISVYDDGALIARSSVSTGVPHHPTPIGVFSVIGKQRWHESNIYSAAPMPYMQRITWSGIALHAGVLPGHPASHGCIRLRTDFAIRLYHLTKRGTRVIIAPEDARPVEIANPHLFPGAKAAAGSGANAYGPIVTANAVHAQGPAGGEPEHVITATPRKVVPISVFVSRRLGKLFVRQGFTPLFEAPVTIQHPEASLGTHVFTAAGVQTEGAALRWTVVSMPEKSSLPQGSVKNSQSPGKRPIETAAPAPSPEKANAALDRIEIPPETVARISELLTPGSSLIVSDYGISEETGSDTDFIVVMP